MDDKKNTPSQREVAEQVGSRYVIEQIYSLGKYQGIHEHMQPGNWVLEFEEPTGIHRIYSPYALQGEPAVAADAGLFQHIYAAMYHWRQLYG